MVPVQGKAVPWLLRAGARGLHRIQEKSVCWYSATPGAGTRLPVFACLPPTVVWALRLPC